MWIGVISVLIMDGSSEFSFSYISSSPPIQHHPNIHNYGDAAQILILCGFPLG